METNFKVDVPSFALGFNTGKKKGGSGGGKEPILTELTVTENGVYDEPVIGGGLEPITWDGVVGDRVNASLDQISYVKLSDTALSKEDFVGATISMSNGQTFELSDEMVFELGAALLAAEVVVSIPYDNVSVPVGAANLVFPEKGLYFFANGGDYTVSLTFPASEPVPADGWNKVTVNVAGDIVDVPELPTENIDEGTCYRVAKTREPAVYVHHTDGTLLMLTDGLGALGLTVQYHFVDTIPETDIFGSMETGIAAVYVSNATGQSYVGLGSSLFLTTAELLEVEKDYGWVNDVSEMTDIGVYALRAGTQLSYGLSTGENATIYGYNGSSWDELAVKEPLFASANFTDYAVLSGSTDGITVTDTTNDLITCMKIPDYVTVIGNDAFNSCMRMTSIIIPASVTSIGDGAFLLCTKLSDIAYMGTKEQWRAITFGDSWILGPDVVNIICTDGTLALDVDGNYTEI